MFNYGYRVGILASSRPVSIPAAMTNWRLLFTETNDTGPGGQGLYITITEINFRPVVGTPVTMTGQGTATASSVYAGAGTWTPNQAHDGNTTTTAWICAAGAWSNSWWRFQYSSPVEIKQVALSSYPSANGAMQMMKTATLQKSTNGTTWHNVLTISNQTGWSSSGETRLFNV